MLLLRDVLFLGKAMVPADILTRFEPWHSVLGDRPIQNHYLADVILTYHPMKEYVAASLRAGELPLWLPGAALGYPVMTSESFFTWAFPLYATFDFWTARGLELFGTLMLAGSFAYAYLKYLRCTRSAALLGALVAMLGFQFTQNLLNGQFVQPLLWTPLILMALDHARRQRSHAALVIAGGVTGIALLAGSLQGMLYVLSLVGIDISWSAFRLLRTGDSRGAIRRFLLEGTTVVGIGLIVGSMRLLPSLELLSLSERGLELSLGAWARAAGNRLMAIPMLLIATVSPDALGDHRSLDVTKLLGQLGIRGTVTGQEFKPYIGIVPLGCLLWSVAKRREDERIRRFLVLLVAPVLFAAVTPLAFFLYFPRGLVMSVFPMAMLTAIGADSLLERTEVETLRRIGRRWATALVVLFVAGTLLTIAIRARHDPLVERAQVAVSNRIDPRADSVERVWQLGKASRFVDAFSFPSDIVNRPAFWGLMALGCILLLARGQRSAAIGLALLSTTVDLAGTARAFLPVVDRQEVFPELPVTTFLRTHAPGARILTLPNFVGGRLFFPPNALVHYGNQDIRISDSMFPTQGLTRIPEMYDAIGLEYIITPPDVSSAEGVPVYEKEVRVLRRPSAFGLAYATYGVRRSPSDSAGASMVKRGEVDLRREVLLDGSDDAPPPANCATARVGAQRLGGSRVIVRADLACAGYVVLADRFYPGWKARIGGNTVPILRANLGLRAVKVPAGQSTVVFSFEPNSFRLGAILTLIGAILVITSVAVVHRYRPALSDTPLTSV